MNRSEILYKLRETSINRLDMLIATTNNLIKTNPTLNIETGVLRRYRSKLKSKKKEIESITNYENIYLFDISEIEKDLSLLIEDVRFKEEYSNEYIDYLKRLLWDKGISLIIYPTNNFEYSESVVPDSIFFIGVPLSLIHEKHFIPLIFHEIGHHFYKDRMFKNFSDEINSKIDNLRDNGTSPSTFGHRDESLIAKARFLEWVIPEWKKEFFSDLFAAYMCSIRYIDSFVLFQINRAYFSLDETDPPNKLRFEILLKYLELSEMNETQIRDMIEQYSGLIQTDKRLEIKTRGIFNERLKEILVNDFNVMIKEIRITNELKNETLKKFEEWQI